MEEWFKPRGYKHLDSPVGESFAAAISTNGFVEGHSWTPLISYVKNIKRYKRSLNKTVTKHREIMYASHRDACILSKFAFDLSAKLESAYFDFDLSKSVIGYRKLGKANYDFSADARKFAKESAPCVMLAFDVSGFFDNLDHAILKNRLKNVLGVKELSASWYKVFRHVTQYRKISRGDLEANPIFGARIKSPSRRMIGTIAEVINASISIQKNENSFGIPQGTPISAVLANLYLIELDKTMANLCMHRGALYQRYSDDILIICPELHEIEIAQELEKQLSAHKLLFSKDKSERVVFVKSGRESIQYLGFDLSPSNVTLRASSLSRQWRKLRKSIKKTKLVGEVALAEGRSNLIYTKKLRKRFSPVGVRNFSAYARRSSDVFKNSGILKQVRRIERAADKAIRELNPAP